MQLNRVHSYHEVNTKLVRDMASEREIKAKDMQKVHHDRKSVVREFSVGDYVLVFRPIRKGTNGKAPLLLLKR